MSDHTIDSEQATSPSSDPRAINRARFELELEFVQSLANPFYLHSLAQQNILEQPTFINYLKYLLYFKEKDYARFIQSDSSLYTFVFSVSCSLVHVPLAIRMRYITSIYSNMHGFGLR
jgi:SOH1